MDKPLHADFTGSHILWAEWLDGVLAVKFQAKPTKKNPDAKPTIYRYYGVPEQEFHGLRKEPHPGEYFYHRIQQRGYRYERVAPRDAAAA